MPCWVSFDFFNSRLCFIAAAADNNDIRICLNNAIGLATKAIAQSASAFGNSASASAAGASALGVGASARADNSIAIGSAAVTEGRE